MADLLEIISKRNAKGIDIGITHLTWMTGHNQWHALRLIMAELLDTGMITTKTIPPALDYSKRGHTVYFITEKGTHFLRLYRKLKACIEKMPNK